MSMEELKVSKIIVAIKLMKDDAKRIFAPKHKDMIEEVSVCAK